jgi:D-threonine aldolase
MAMDWYQVSNAEEIDSPALLIFPERAKENIRRLISSVDHVDRLRPHVKTHKSAEVTRMMLDAGIKKVKCSTIAEAEMLGGEKMPDVLLAYQPVGPKANRLAELTLRFPQTKFSCLIDTKLAAQHLSETFAKIKKPINVYIDLNVGMNRTGIAPESAFDLFKECSNMKGIEIVGLHAYDGHLRDTDFQVRTKRCDDAFDRIVHLQQKIQNDSGKKLKIVAGGTPTFSIHSKRKDIECSPGTYVYWDKGYENILKEQHYLHAALVMARVISLPAENMICVDLGHKAIAAENPLPNRVYFLNAPELEPTGHSEEHMVFKTTNENKYAVGDVLYGVPFHVCPTIALYDIANVVMDGRVSQQWRNESRKRSLSV